MINGLFLPSFLLCELNLNAFVINNIKTRVTNIIFIILNVIAYFNAIVQSNVAKWNDAIPAIIN